MKLTSQDGNIFDSKDRLPTDPCNRTNLRCYACSQNILTHLITSKPTVVLLSTNYCDNLIAFALKNIQLYFF